MQKSSEDPFELPLTEADQVIHDQIEHHRSEMSRWRKVRAQRVADEHAAGRSIADIKDDLGVHADVVYKLLRLAKADRT